MIKVLIVDDEYLLRELIKDSLNYEELGYEIIGEAEDGIVALEKVDLLRPQLIILDINIPFINGIELSKVIREKYEDIKIIILTGYSEFEYAKECIKIGVDDYLLKPIEPDNFKKVLIAVKNKIVNETSQKQYLTRLEKESKNSTDILKEQFLNQLILEKNMQNTSIKVKINKYGIFLCERNIVVITLKIDNFQTRWEKDEDKKLWQFAVLNISSEIFSSFKSAVTFYGPNNLIVCIANEDFNSTDTSNISILNECTKVSTAIESYLGFTVTIGVGEKYNNFENISKSFDESHLAMCEKFFEGFGRVFSYQNISTVNRSKEIIIGKSKEELLVLLRSDSSETYLQIIEGFKQQMICLRPSVNNIRMVYTHFVSAVLAYAWENNLKTEDILVDIDDYIYYINSIETIIELNQWVINLSNKVVHMVKNLRKSKTANLVEKAKNYIELNYSNPNISLEEICERIYINPSYLSKVFKKEIKYSVIEYLTDFRMKKSKQIMDEHKDIQISHVANEVGYSDPFYFSKLFKKHFGISPSKYMEKT